MADEATPRNGDSYVQRLRQGEEYAFWKLSLRTAICVLDVIAIGAAGWTLAQALRFHSNPYIGYFSGSVISPFVLAACSLSFIFCLVCILVLLLRKPPKPAHPGIAVGCDLILWMALIIIAYATVIGAVSLQRFGNDGRTLADPSYYNGDYSGEYVLAPNNTWVYNITSVSPYTSTSTGTGGYGTYFWNSTRGNYQLNTTRPSLSSVHRDCSGAPDAFASCAQQDAYINSLWHSRHTRFAVAILGAAVQCILVVLHFVLFVWACVDTHKRNMSRRQRRVNAVADRVIQDMQARGLITVHANARQPEGQPLMAERRGGGDGVAGPSVQR